MTEAKGLRILVYGQVCLLDVTRGVEDPVGSGLRDALVDPYQNVDFKEDT